MNALPQNVLLTQGELVNYAGSEIVTLELAEWFASRGARVDVLAHIIGDPILQEFKKIKNVFIHTDPNTIDYESKDLIWIHHQLIPQKVVELFSASKLTARVFFHHMSPYHPLEQPFFFRIEKALADAVLFNSHETMLSIQNIFKFSKQHSLVFGNPAPEAFMVEPTKKSYRKKLSDILVVSNHPPKELLDACKVLNGEGVRIRYVGISGEAMHTRVIPKDIQQADIVISIGKTVQYALVGGAVVYIYDHFGGPGYLSKHSFRKAKDLNFSGRGFETKTTDTIVNEIKTGYAKAVRYTKTIHRVESESFSLTSKIEHALRLPTKKPHDNFALGAHDYAAFMAGSTYLRILGDEIHRSRNSITRYLKENELLKMELEKKQQETIAIEKRLNEVIHSRSWKVTKPIRIAKNHIRRDRTERTTQ